MECPICFGEKWITYTPCNHLICMECLTKIRHDRCPTCRKPLFSSLPIEIKRIVQMGKKIPFSGDHLPLDNMEEFPNLS